MLPPLQGESPSGSTQVKPSKRSGSKERTVTHGDF